MPRHKLAAGAEIISSLVSLGRTLGYVTNEEFPTEQPNVGGPAVDVAWLSDARQRFPIMVFEIESKTTNSAANNPVKVFGPPNEDFEKPLFFFHVFVTGGNRTSRLENLRRLFGTHNYRTYRLKAGEIPALLKDILSQHRRLSLDLDLVSLTRSIESTPSFRPYVSEVLLHTESLGFNVDYFVSYATLAKENANHLDHFVRHLRSHYQTPNRKRLESGYTTFLGANYSDPIHLGILQYLLTSDHTKWLNELKKWQESSSPTQIGPHFGLSLEYDQFIIGLAAPFWALVAGLMRNDRAAVKYILDQHWLILEATNPSPFSIFQALWGLHIAAAINSITHFERARAHINDLGGLASNYLYEPPSAIHVEAEDEWFENFQMNTQLVPDLNGFVNLHPFFRPDDSNNDKSLLRLALSVLSYDSAFYEWSSTIVAALAPIVPKTR